MIVANVKMNFRNRMALFWNLAFPLLFIFLFGFLFNQDSFSVSVGVAGSDVTPITSQVTEAMTGADGLDVTTGPIDDELEALEDGNRAVVVVFSQSENGDVVADLYWDEADPQLGTVARGVVRQFLNDANMRIGGLEPAIVVQERAVESRDLDYMDFLVPGVLGMSIMNSGMIGLASGFVTYREKGILRRIRATPFPLSSFIAARIVSQLVTSVLQAFILITAGVLLFDLDIVGNLFNVFVVIVIGSLAFLSLGFVIAAFARNQESADALANGLSLPMLFLSGVFFPVDSAPSWLRPIMRIIPLRYLVDALRDLMVRGAALSDQALNVAVLLATCVVGFLLAVRTFRWDASTV